MRHNNIIIGNYYKHKESPQFWAKAIEILPPGKGENTTKKILVKCEWCYMKGDSIGLIKYFKPSDLKKVDY